MNGPNNPIGWCDYTWNPIKGLCPVGCPYCYARRIYDRFHYDPTIRLDEKELQAPCKLKKPSRIFVGSTIELFGNWIEPDWLYQLIRVIEENPQHTFQFLTKFPQRISNIFPDNCWIGTTVTTASELSRIGYLKRYRRWITFASFEPLLDDLGPIPAFFLDDIDWIISGAETGNRKGKIIPEEKWIASILGYADNSEIPIFMKDNLKPHWRGKLRQEFPE